jgi:hypothetical protein
LSQPASQVDEMKISSGVSQSHVGDELIEIVQYTRVAGEKWPAVQTLRVSCDQGVLVLRQVTTK